MLLLIVLILTLRGGIQIYKARYIEIQNGSIKISKMVGKLRIGIALLEGKMRCQCDEFPITDICKMGYTQELYGKAQEFHQGEMPYQIKNHEMIFELQNGEKITLDVFWFTRKKMKKLFRIIYEETEVNPRKN